MLPREERRLLSKVFPLVDLGLSRWLIYMATALFVVSTAFSLVWDLLPLFTQVITAISVVLLTSSFLWEFLRGFNRRKRFRNSVLAVGKYSDDVMIIYRENADLDMLGVARLLANQDFLIEDILKRLQTKDSNLLLNERALSPYMIVTFKQEGTVYNQYSMVQKRVKSIQREQFIDVESQHDLLTIVQLVKHGLSHRIISRAYPYWSEKQHHELIEKANADKAHIDPELCSVR